MAAVPATDMPLKDMDSPNPAMANDGIVPVNVGSATSPVPTSSSVPSEGEMPCFALWRESKVSDCSC